MRGKIMGGLVSLTLAVSPFAGFSTVYAADTPTYQTTARQTERLNRGLVATYKTEDSYSVLSGEGGVYLSWRLLGDESLTNQAFDIYRSTSENGTFTKIATTKADGPTNYTDTGGDNDELLQGRESGRVGDGRGGGNGRGSGHELYGKSFPCEKRKQ